MDNAILKKRLSTYKTGEKGRLQQVSDEVIVDVLRTWENWPGRAADLYRELGLSKMQMCIMIKKGKKLIKSGVIPESGFKEVKIEGTSGAASCKDSIYVKWEKGKLIRFQQVDQVVDFLKKVS